MVLSSDGKELAVFKRANRDWVKLADISPKVIDALIATEDHRFYQHHGMDLKRTASALLHTLTGDLQGGSTLTQQLARNLYPEEIGRSATLTRKIREAITALKIESVYTKDEILETYLNTVPFLYNAYGIEMAARTYFDKSAGKLDVLESATLVGMLKGTSYYNPVQNPERSVQRRNIVLAQMVKHGKLPEASAGRTAEKAAENRFRAADRNAGSGASLCPAAQALADRMGRPQQLQHLRRRAGGAHHDRFAAAGHGQPGRGAPGRQAAAAGQRGVGAARRLEGQKEAWCWPSCASAPEFKAALEAGQTPEQALQQLQADATFMQKLHDDKTRLQAGFLALDPRNGQVRAWVGSRDFTQDQFDHVSQARRQPGSTFKPFVYGAAFEDGARPTDTFVDQAVADSAGQRRRSGGRAMAAAPAARP